MTGCGCLLAGSLYLAMGDLQGGLNQNFNIQTLSNLVSQGFGPYGKSS
jgi:hypothetical protein